MVGLLKRVYRQYRSAAHREGLHELKELEKQTRDIAGKLRAREDLDDGDKRRLEELKDKLVAFPRWLMAEWRLADREYQIKNLKELTEGLRERLARIDKWLLDQGDDSLDNEKVKEFQERILRIEEWLEEKQGYTAQLSKVLEKENKKIEERREKAAREFEEGALTVDAKILLKLSPDQRPPIGLAFSGGGIRSATFNLGLVQGLAKYRILPWVDYLTSVSGGGFTAACMTTLLSMDRGYGKQKQYYFNTQWERFPFNPELEVFDHDGVAEEKNDAEKAADSSQPAPEVCNHDGVAEEKNDAEKAADSSQPKLKRGRNRQLVYLRDRGNWLVPRMGWATRDVLRGVGGFLLRPTYTVMVFFLALLALAAFHYGLNAALVPSIMQNIAPPTLDKVLLVPPQPHLWTTLGVGIAFALLSGLVLRKLYRNDPTMKYKMTPWKSPNYKLQTRTYLTLAGVRGFAGLGFLVLFLLTCGLWVGQLLVLSPEFRSPFSLPLLQFRQLAESQHALPHFFWAWTVLFAVFAAAAGWFVLRYSKDDTWVETGLPEQLRIDTLVMYAFAGLGLWAATLLLFWLRLQSFGAGDASPQVFWIWLPAVFALGSLLGFLLFRILPLRQHVYAKRDELYPESLRPFDKWWFGHVLGKADQPARAKRDVDYYLSIWSNPEFRSIISTLQGLALYGLIAFAVLALLLLPHSLSVETGTDPRAVVPLATLILSSAWAAVLTYAKDKASFQATNLVTKIAIPSGTLGNYLLGLLVILLNLSLIFIMQSVLDSRATWHPYCIGGAALLLLCIVGRYLNFNYLSPHLLYSDRIAEVCLKTDVERDGWAKIVRDERQERLYWITPEGCSAPNHIVQTTLNLPGTWRLKPKDRKSEPFIFSKWYCGSDMTGYVRNDPGQYRGGVTRYAEAVGLSGAAISPGLGFRTFFAQAFMTTFLNVRLGLWLTNPQLYKPGVPRHTARPHDAERTAFWPLYLWDEARAQISERRDLINLTDGEHTGDGIGLYPLFQRRCKFIIAGDAGGDPAGTGRGLFTVLRQVKDDLGIKVDIDVEGTKPEEYDPEKKVAKPSKRHFAVGTIKYPATFDEQGNQVLPEQDGWLIYFKPAVTEEDPGAIRAYWNTHKMEFPVPPTADQMFEEEQWEMQRWVGEITVEHTLKALKSHYEEKVKGGGSQADRDKLKFLQGLLAFQRIDFELLAKYPTLLEGFLQVLYDISNDATAKAEAKETPAEGNEPATRNVHRDAKTGRFVTKEYTEEHPDTTVTETVE